MKNAGRDVDNYAQVKTRGVNIGRSGASVIEIDNDDSESDGEALHGGVPPRVKQELIIVEDVTEDDLKDEYDVIPPLRTPRKSKQNMTPEREYAPTMRGEQYTERVHEGVGFPQVSAEESIQGAHWCGIHHKERGSKSTV